MAMPVIAPVGRPLLGVDDVAAGDDDVAGDDDDVVAEPLFFPNLVMIRNLNIAGTMITIASS
jgi:hypothetical protein